MSKVREIFKSDLDPSFSICEVGTLRWRENDPTHHTDWCPDAKWTMVDETAGPDVDVVSDVHNLNEFADNTFDAFIACSVWEHIERPWVAAQSVVRVLKPGGLFYIETHQSFPLHGYPSDFFRFSREALELIFRDAGILEMVSGYTRPGKIIPPPEVEVWDPTAPVWLCVDIAGQKAGG